MFRTLIACVTVLVAFGSAIGHITRGFESWTFDDVRRADARTGHLVVTATPLRTASGQDVVAWLPGDGRNPVTIVDVFYARCVTVCYVLGSEFAQMQAALAASGPSTRGPQLLSLSLDPEHDDQAALSGYARRQGAKPEWWTVAAPRDAGASQRLLDQLEVIAIADGFGGFVHNGAIQVIDRRGVVRGVYGITQWREALRAAWLLASSNT